MGVLEGLAGTAATFAKAEKRFRTWVGFIRVTRATEPTFLVEGCGRGTRVVGQGGALEL